MARPADAGKRAQSDPSSYLRPSCARTSSKRARRAGPRTVSARLSARARLEARPDGHIFVRLEGYSLDLGWFSPAVAKRVLAAAQGRTPRLVWIRRPDHRREIESLIRRLARHGLLEYPVGQKRDADAVIIEPQVPDYRPRTPELRNADVLALSRFAYLRRRGDAMVLESPRAPALFRICDPKIATALAVLSTPQQVGRLRRQAGFPGIELLALLVDCQILFRVDPAHEGNLRPAEGDADLVLWDFHDLLFHARSTPGRHANPLGGALSICGRHALRRRRCGAAGPERRSICASSRARLRRFRQPRGCCVNVIRSAASMTSGRSRSPSLRGFSTAPRVSCRHGKAGSTSAAPARWSLMRRGRIRRRAQATSSSSISRSTNATGSRADFIITTPAGTRWCRSTYARRNSKRC